MWARQRRRERVGNAGPKPVLVVRLVVARQMQSVAGREAETPHSCPSPLRRFWFHPHQPPAMTRADVLLIDLGLDEPCQVSQ